MTRWHAILLVSLIAVSLAGCSSKAALPAKKVPPLAGPARTAPSRQPERAAKPVARESSFSTYANPDYGVTFRYPRNFALVERAALAEQDASEDGAPLDASGARSQEELEQEEPGAVLVATVVVPDDAYPNTTFAGGSLQFAVNRYQTAGSCRRELVSRLGDSNGRNGALTIQGVEFAWVRQRRRRWQHGIFRARLRRLCEWNVLPVLPAGRRRHRGGFGWPTSTRRKKDSRAHGEDCFEPAARIAERFGPRRPHDRGNQAADSLAGRATQGLG